MKLFKSSILAVLALGAALSACNESSDYSLDSPGAQSPGLYFPETQATSVKAETTGSEFVVTVGRTGSKSAMSYKLTTDYDDDIFYVPSTISFAANATTADLIVKYDATKMIPDESYKIGIAFGSNVPVSAYGKTQIEIAVRRPAAWKAAGVGYWTDDVIAPLYGEPIYTYPVQVEENMERPGYFRLVQPYHEANPFFKEIFDEQEWTDEMFATDLPSTVYMYIDATDPEKVVIERYNVGINLGQGVINIASPTMYSNWPAEQYGKYDAANFLITWPEESIAAILGTSAYISNASGRTQLVLPGGSVSDYNLAISYLGMFTDVDDKSFAHVDATLGADVAKAVLGAVETTSQAAALDAVVNGEVEVVEISTSTKPVALPIPSAGDYIAVIVGYNADGEAVGEAYCEFTIKDGIVEDDSKEWTSLGLADYEDGWVVPMFTSGGVQLNPANYPWTVEVQQHKTTAGLYRLVDPFHAEDCPLLDNNSRGKSANIVIDCSDPANVLVPVSYSGYTDGDGDIFVSNIGQVLATDGLTPKDEFKSTLEDGIISIVYPVWGPAADDCQYLAIMQQGQVPFTGYVYLPLTEESSVAAKVKYTDHKIMGSRTTMRRVAGSSANYGVKKPTSHKLRSDIKAVNF